MTYEEVLALSPFDVAKEEKERLLRDQLLALMEHHSKHCASYARILETIGFSDADVRTAADIPFLPVRLFKELELKSILDEEIFKTMTSSGTSGQQVSKIYLDRETATNQQKTLVRIMSVLTGGKRMPMIIIDSPSVLKNRSMFSARGAGVLGFSIFASKKIYALNDAMELQMDAIRAFLEEHAGERILFFGFTFMVWQHFYKVLRDVGMHLYLKDAVLIHGGGWKKLVQEQVSPQEFRNSLQDVCGDVQVIDYYGMVEQTGCIYLECEEGHLHASTYADVLIRRQRDFSLAPMGEKGLIEVLSLLPTSYPGHALLTEDEGVLLGEDDCPCGRKGKYFKVLGRIQKAELRGCSDTYASTF